MNPTKLVPTLVLVAGGLSLATTSEAVVYGGIDFPDGLISFVDAVVSYDPLYGGGPGPTNANFTDPDEAIGAPDYTGGSSGTGAVSLGDGGRIVLRFINNFLTGSDNGDKDLHIFEVGPDVEDTFVDISKDGLTWFSIGKVTGATSSIDIDAFGYTSADQFSYVRLTDDTNLDGQSGSTVGADIDAVGAISTVRNTAVPDAGSSLLLAATAFCSLVGARRFANRK